MEGETRIKGEVIIQCDPGRLRILYFCDDIRKKTENTILIVRIIYNIHSKLHHHHIYCKTHSIASQNLGRLLPIHCCNCLTHWYTRVQSNHQEQLQMPAATSSPLFHCCLSSSFLAKEFSFFSNYNEKRQPQ